MTIDQHAGAGRQDLYRAVTERILAALERGVAPWVCPWRRDRERGRQRNGATGHVYRGINVILATMAGFASTRWYTAPQAVKLGAAVREGERGTELVYWRYVDAAAVMIEGVQKPARRYPLLLAHTLFNAEQIAWSDGSPHAMAKAEPPSWTLDDRDRARALVEASGAALSHRGTAAFYRPSDDCIVLPEPVRFSDGPAYYATALHELSHWTGHPSRLARDLTGRFRSEAYAAEELVAELSTAFLCATLGLEGHLQHDAYIGSWVKVLREDRRAIFDAARLAQAAADYLLAKLPRPPKEPRRPRRTRTRTAAAKVFAKPKGGVKRLFGGKAKRRVPPPEPPPQPSDSATPSPRARTRAASPR